MPESLPRVSVVMPIRNEARYITESLGAVLQQDYPADLMEILIADGESTDNTRELIRQLDTTNRVRVISNPGRTQARALNLLFAAATGEIIIRVDGHTVIAPDYVRQCVAVLARTGAANAGGGMVAVGTTAMGKAIAAATGSPFAVPTAFHVSQKEQPTDTVYMGAWPRAIIEKIGQFDESFRANEDYEFNYRIRQAGGTIWLSPAIQSRYYGRQTLKDLTRQYFIYGRSKVDTLLKAPGSVRPRHLVAPVFVLCLVGGALLAIPLPVVRMGWLSLICIYSIVNLVFSVRVAQRHRLPAIWRIWLVFATIHLAWGSGFWAGIVTGGTTRRRFPSHHPIA